MGIFGDGSKIYQVGYLPGQSEVLQAPIGVKKYYCACPFVNIRLFAKTSDLSHQPAALPEYTPQTYLVPSPGKPDTVY
jgi:hypothetical protein